MRVILWSLAGAISFWASGIAVSALWEDAPLLVLTLLPLAGPSICFPLSLGRHRTNGRIAMASILLVVALWATGPWISLAQEFLAQGRASIPPSPPLLDFLFRFPLASLAIATYSGTLLAMLIAALLSAGICLAAGVAAVRNRGGTPARTALAPRS